MKKPTHEQMLYAQLAIVDSLIEYLSDNMKGSIFEEKNDIADKIFLMLREDVDKLRLHMKMCFVQSEVV